MYISKFILENFKIYEGKNEFNFSQGMNFFIGNNNCGKTTIFDAMNFLLSGGNREELITKSKKTTNENISVEIEIRGEKFFENLKQTEDKNLKKYIDYIENDENGDFLRLKRTSDNNIIEKDPIKKILVRYKENNENKFKNVSGIDTALKQLFTVTNFGANEDLAKNIKKLLLDIVNSRKNELENHEKYPDFKNLYKEIFNDGKESFSEKVESEAQKIKDNLVANFGVISDVKIKFDDDFNISDLLKNNELQIQESQNDDKISVFEKGTGIQRALAISLMEIFADDKVENFNTIFLIDEPETFLHPVAQNNFANSLAKISKNAQVFINTHSPYFLRNFKKDTNSLKIFTKSDGKIKNQDCKEIGIFGNDSPTFGEINYFAYGIYTEEFHNELYEYLIGEDRQENFNDELRNKESKEKTYTRNGNSYPTPLPTYIRNYYNHHTANGDNNNDAPNIDELSESTEFLLSILKNKGVEK